MQTVSTKFVSAVANSHAVALKIEVYNGSEGDLLYSSVLSNTAGGVYDGEVSIQDQEIRRRISSLYFTDPSGDLTPTDANDLFAPYGNELRIYRGIRYLDGTEPEYIPLGVFPISDCNVDDTGASLNITLQAYDRAWRVKRAKLTDDYVVASGQDYAVAIQNLISAGVPTLPFSFTQTGIFTPQLVFETGGDRWEKAQAMAASCGCELFFDANGVCILQFIPDYNTVDPVWNYVEGPTGVMLYVNKRMTSEDVFNHWIVLGEHSTPVRGEAIDTNPDSPTYFMGKYGDVVGPVERSSLVTTTNQAILAARGKLQRSIGTAERVHFNAIVNPAHDIGDVIEIERARSKVDARYVIQQLSIPLTHARAMDVLTRRRTT